MLEVNEWMQRRVIAIEETDGLEKVEQLMRERHVRHLPVVRGGRLVGLISHRDFIRALEISRRRKETDPVWAMDLMTRDLITVTPDTPMREAVALFLEHKVGCLPVVQGVKLVGILSETDVVRLCGELIEQIDRRELAAEYDADA